MFESDDMSEADLLSTLDEVIYYLNDHINRDVSIIQTRILLNSNKNLVLKNLNTFIADTTYSSEYKSNIIHQILNKITTIYKTIPIHLDLNKVRLEYQSLTNFLRMHMVNIYQNSNFSQTYSTTNLLNNLLLEEIPVIDTVLELPDYEEDPHPFCEIAFPLSNFFQSTWGIFESLISFLPVIDKETLSKWTDIMLKNTKLHWDLYEKFDILKLFTTKRIMKVEEFIENIFILANTQMSMCFYLLELYPRYNNNDRKRINTYGIVEEFSLEHIHLFLQKCKEFVSKKYSDLQIAYKSYLFSRNDDPEKMDSVSNFKLFLNHFDLQDMITKFYLEKKQDDQNLMKQIVSKSAFFITRIVEMVGGEEQLLQSYYLNTYLLIIHDVQPFVARLAVLSDDQIIYEDFRFEYRYIIERIDVDDDASFYFMDMLAKLYVYTHLKKEIDFDTFYDDYEKRLDYFLLYPRLYLAICVQMILFSYLSDRKTAEHRLQILKDIEFNEIISNQKGITEHDFRLFQNYINDVDKGKTSKFPLQHRMKIIELDFFSWLVPDFSWYFAQKNMENIPYIPFNLAVDSIIDK